MAACTAYNSLPRRPLGLAPETLWRALRPLESRWRNRTLKATVNAPAAEITDEEWLQILDEYQAAGEDVYKQATESFAQDLQSLQHLVSSAAARAQMARRVKSRKRAAPIQAPLVTGDRVLCKSTQYRSTTGFGKFECSGEGLRKYTVVSLSGGIATLQEPSTGNMLTRHESLLKIMPHAIKPGQCADKDEVLPSPLTKKCTIELETLGPFWILRAKPDGACFYRACAMALQIRAGVHPAYVQDSDVRVEELRNELARFAELFLQGCSVEELAREQADVEAKLQDEPTWDASVPFTWPRFLDLLRYRLSYSSFWTVGKFVKKHQLTIQIVAKTEAANDVTQLWNEDCPNSQGRIVLLKTLQHYDLLVPRRMPKR